MEQLAAGHIEPSNSPWNTPIFVIKKKIRKMEIVTRFEGYKRNYGRHGGLPARPPFPGGCAFSVPTPVFLPGKSHEQRSLVGHSPQGHKRAGRDLATKQQQHFMLQFPNFHL